MQKFRNKNARMIEESKEERKASAVATTEETKDENQETD